MGVPVPKGRTKTQRIALSLAAHGGEELVKAGWEAFRCEPQSSERFRHVLNLSLSSVREPFSRLRLVCPAPPIAPSVAFSRGR
jgi:hypothetical protein